MSRHSKSGRLIETWTQLVFAHPWLIIILSLGITFTGASQLPRLFMDNSFVAYMPETDQARLQYDGFRRAFEEGERAHVLVGTDRIFDPGFLNQLRALHHALETELPYVHEVSSLVNVTHVQARGDTLYIGELLDPWPTTTAELADIEARALADPLLHRTYISDDRLTTAITVELDLWSSDTSAGEQTFLTGTEMEVFTARLYELTERFRGEGMAIRLTGSPVMSYELMLFFAKKMALLSALANIVIGVLVFLFLRRISAVIYALIIASFAVIAAFCIVAVAGIPVSGVTQTLPTLLTAICVANSIHVLSIFFQTLNRGVAQRAAVAEAMSHTAKPIVIAHLTTAAGMGSFMVSGVVPLANVGLLAPIAICFSLVYILALLPALLTVTRYRVPSATARRRAQWHRRLQEGLRRVTAFSMEKPGTMLAGCAVLLLLALAGIQKTWFTFQPIHWLDGDNPVRMATESYDRHMAGTGWFDVLLDTGQVDGIKQPELLRSMDASLATLTEAPHVAGTPVIKTTSVGDVLKLLNKALHADNPLFYRLPDTRAQVSQLLLLYEMSGREDLAALVDEDYQVARLLVSVPFTDAREVIPLQRELQRHFRDELGRFGEVTVTGTHTLVTRTLLNVVKTLFHSYGLALLCISVLMMLMIGSLRLGLIAMLPNVLPAVLVAGMAGWLGIGFDIHTIMVGSVALGIAVDDTIHYTCSVKRLAALGHSLPASIYRTVHTTGRALLYSSLILGASFLVNLAGGTAPVVNYGILAASAVILAFFADIVLIPALLGLTRWRFADTRSVWKTTEPETVHP